MNPKPQEQLAFSLEPERHIFRVCELNQAVQRLFEHDFSSILVLGEVSGCRLAASGHYYFALKDEQSQIKCVLFKGTARYARCKPQEGLAVLARGSLEVYEARGEYQLIVESLEPRGAGALQIAFDQLKKRLGEEGLFDTARKRKLPQAARRIGVITSPSGAVVRDILQVLERRFRGLHVRLFPAQVQGEGSIDQVCSGLRFFSQKGWADVVILARGGGSLEDLWTFNEEAVARAIAASAIPIISAIGHETDFTIADFVADHRAPTPSAAAEIVVCTKDSLLERIAGARNKCLQGLRYRFAIASRDLHQLSTERAARIINRRFANSGQKLDELFDRLRGSNQKAISGQRKRFEELARQLAGLDLRLKLVRNRHRRELLAARLENAIQSILSKAQNRRDSLSLHLRQMSPVKILERGYAIAEKLSGEVLTASDQTAAGERIHIRLHRGELEATILSTELAAPRN